MSIERVSAIYGKYTFNRKVMQERLSKNTFRRLMTVIEMGGELDSSVADEVASVMKEWAIEFGATHFCHWFQPQRGETAEKHDSFMTFTDNGSAIEQFSGKQLIQSEPDASSFPSGGMRSTFEARGYTAWDPSSPAFIVKGEKYATLVIPSVFLSYTGEPLDLKTPFLRSLAVVEKSAYKVLKLFGNRTAKYVKTTVGPEQEYFVIDKQYYFKRPDLLFTGHTLIGAASAKGQQMEDHYFGAIKPRVLNFMEELDMELYYRGIPSKTRHNEVAPHQFEIAPIFEEANLAVDHNLQCMEIMRTIGDKHGLTILMHEKPFAGINGSGKHLNWSMSDSDGNNLLEPGSAPKKNIQFLVFLSAILIGVQKYGGLLRMAVAGAGNDHRLGANEAPPAIISVFLGEYLNNLMEEIATGEISSEKARDDIDLKVKRLPRIALDNTDRNRTSPMAFTGNKFEFRAVGSSQNCAEPAMIMNLVVAHGLDVMVEKIETLSKKSNDDIRDIALQAIKQAVVESRDVRFEGNNYGEEWHKEAAKRGLPNDRNTPAALSKMTLDSTVELFQRYEILSKSELESKKEIKLEEYCKLKTMELHIIVDLVNQHVLPAIARQMTVYANGLSAVQAAGLTANKTLTARLEQLNSIAEGLGKGLDKAAKILADYKKHSVEEAAELLANKGVPVLEEIRLHCDSAEVIIDSQLWDLPRYGEMLFMM